MAAAGSVPAPVRGVTSATVSAHTPVRKVRPASAADSGVRAGHGAPQQRVTGENWLEPPFNRWGYGHARELTRTARVGRGGGAVWRLPTRPIDLSTFHVLHEGERFTYVEMLQATYTDALVVVHDGELVFEYYDHGVRPDDNHLLMAVSMPLTATLVGILVSEGRLATEAPITRYLSALAGTAWEGCTLQHVLDMRVGVDFHDDDPDDPSSDGRLLEQVAGYTTRRRDDLPADMRAWIRTLAPQGRHGGSFAYRSILADVLGWVVEEVTGERFADVFSQRLWSRLGAEHDADLIIDAAGFPISGGGLCATARDLARFGVMHLQQGLVGGANVVPARWIDRVAHRDEALIQAFGRAGRGAPLRRGEGNPEAYFHDCWWVHHAELGRYGGYGVGGQTLMIDRSSNTVVVKLSSTPKRVDPLLNAFADDAHEALFRLLAA